MSLLEHCPAHARAELRRDYRGIVDAKDGLAARKAYAAFMTKWSTLCPAVARSLEETGEELLTFYFPQGAVALAAHDQPVGEPQPGVPPAHRDGLSTLRLDTR